nr:U11/U12 small nuclear ribonucleoprotein 25 kDa protein isoform X1 [Ipomoea batatas]
MSDDTKTKDATVASEYHSSSMKKARLHSTLGALLNDPILADVPKKPSLSDVDTLISLELGSAMRITILKLDNTSIDVAVLNSATVKDLKQAVRKKHVWENFCFSYHNEKLLDDGAKLQDYGVRNNCEVFYLKTHNNHFG